MKREAYISLFDDYHLAVSSVPYDLAEYQLEKDVFLQALQDAKPTEEDQSPNLSLFYPQLSLFEMIDGKRFLLMEYSKMLADMHKASGIPYTIQIRADIPFIRVELPEGELYPLPAICSPELTMPQLETRLKEITPSFTLDKYDPDYCALLIHGRKKEIIVL